MEASLSDSDSDSEEYLCMPEHGEQTWIQQPVGSHFSDLLQPSSTASFNSTSPGTSADLPTSSAVTVSAGNISEYYVAW